MPRALNGSNSGHCYMYANPLCTLKPVKLFLAITELVVGGFAGIYVEKSCQRRTWQIIDHPGTD